MGQHKLLEILRKVNGMDLVRATGARMRTVRVRTLVRRTVQMLSVLLFLSLVRLTRYPLPERVAVNLFFRMDALLGISNTLVTGHVSRYFLPCLVLIGAVLLLGNFFCPWICPLGGIVDLENALILRSRWRLRVPLPSRLRRTRGVLLAGILLLSGLGLVHERVPYLAWPLDPFVIMLRGIVLRGGWMVFLIGIVVFSAVVPRAWCNNFCPLGALYGFVGVRLRLTFRKRWGRADGRNEQKEFS